MLTAGAQMQLDGFVFPAPPRRRRRWPRKPRWEQLPLVVAGTPLVLWQAADAPSPPAPVVVRVVVPRPPAAPAPTTQQALFAAWERRLAEEGMPAEINRDRERPKDPRRLDDYLAGPHGSCRPLKSSRGRDVDGQKAEPGPNFGAWWVDEVTPNEDGAARWEALSDQARGIVDRAIAEAHAVARAEERAQGQRRAAVIAGMLVGYALPLDEVGGKRRGRLAERLGRRCERAQQAAQRAAARSALTVPQARVLRLWFQGYQQTEIARLEGHSKVTVHHKLHRALDLMGEVLRSSVDFRNIV